MFHISYNIDGWNICYNVLNLKEKKMNLKEALAQMMNSKKVRQLDWHNEEWIEFNGNGFFDQDGDCVDLNDYDTQQWSIYIEKDDQIKNPSLDLDMQNIVKHLDSCESRIRNRLEEMHANINKNIQVLHTMTKTLANEVEQLKFNFPTSAGQKSLWPQVPKTMLEDSKCLKG